MPRVAAGRRLTLFALAVAATAAGCATYNPSYFPYYIPGGRVEQTHAKPRGNAALHQPVAGDPHRRRALRLAAAARPPGATAA